LSGEALRGVGLYEPEAYGPEAALHKIAKRFYNLISQDLSSLCAKSMNYPAASYGVSCTCPPLPSMPPLKLPAVPGGGRRVAGGSDFHNLNEASFGEFNPITHACLRADTHRQKNLCLPYEMHFLFLFHRGNLRLPR